MFILYTSVSLLNDWSVECLSFLVNDLHIHRFDPVTMDTWSFCKKINLKYLLLHQQLLSSVHIYIGHFSTLTWPYLYWFNLIAMDTLPFCEALEVSSPSATTTAKLGLMYLYRTLLSPKTRPWEWTCSETTRQIQIYHPEISQQWWLNLTRCCIANENDNTTQIKSNNIND